MVRVLLLVLAATVSLFNTADAYLSQEVQDYLVASSLSLEQIIADADAAIAVAAEMDNAAHQFQSILAKIDSTDEEVTLTEIMALIELLQQVDTDVHQLGMEVRSNVASVQNMALQTKAKLGFSILKERLAQGLNKLVKVFTE